MTATLPMTKYHQIYVVLREQLLEGQFAAGLPGELALMQQFRVARVTVRRALEQLGFPLPGRHGVGHQDQCVGFRNRHSGCTNDGLTRATGQYDHT